MEETQQGSHPAEDWSIKTGEALRVLRERLAVRSEPERPSASEVQSDIIARIFHIAEEMAIEQSTEAQATAELMEEKLASSQATLAEQEAQVSQLQTQLSDVEQECNRLKEELQAGKNSEEELLAAKCIECSELLEKLSALEERAVTAEASVERLQEDAELASKEIEELQSCLDDAAAQGDEAAQLREAVQQAELRSGELGDEVACLSSERDSLAKELSSVSSDLEQHRSESASVETSLRDELKNALEQKVDQEHRSNSIEQERDAFKAELAENSTTIASLRDEIKDLESRSLNEFSEEHQKVLSSEQELANVQQERDSLATELAAIQETVQQLKNEKDSESERLLSELEEAKELAELAQSEFQKLSSENAQLSSKLDVFNEEQSASQVELLKAVEQEAELSAVKEQLSQLIDEKQELETSQEELSRLLEEATTKCEQSAARLLDAEKQLQDVPNQREQSEELEKTLRKFELVLADAQKLKRENAALQEELAKRPEANDQESPELVSLRVERDALAARVSELEDLPAPVVDEDAQQRMEDLQRRFEMAVDDLRQVKQEKAQLEEKMAHGSPGVSKTVDCGAMDWQSQKARLLASLESEETGEEPTPERSQEKLTIQGTIEITDEVVAEKDREIAELQSQLAGRSEEPATHPTAQLVDKDELIQVERAKLEQLQAEWRDKLRGAELEMSTQRASLARKEAELKELLAAAEQATANVDLVNDGKPRRRWLSALGLGEEEPKKE